MLWLICQRGGVKTQRPWLPADGPGGRESHVKIMGARRTFNFTSFKWLKKAVLVPLTVHSRPGLSLSLQYGAENMTGDFGFGTGTWWKNLNSRPLNVIVVPLDVLFRMSDEHSRLCYTCACPLESLAFNLVFSTEKWKYINLYHKRSIAPAKRAGRIDRL